tara:strand:+ start:480 stop:848 length:369 start_codon:yes stop_codon:yes gene_type:complete
MPNISVSDQQSLADELSTRLQNLGASTPNADLVYLTRMIEIFNGAANLSAVSSEGTTQINAVAAKGNTEISELQTEGNTQVTAVQNASTTEQAALSGLQTSITSALNAFQMSPSKVFFLSQS